MESFHSSRGFTLVELMVVLAIVVSITAIVFTSQSSFNKTLTLANTAYDIALSLRSAETYGMSGRVFGTTVNAGYGIHFQKTTPSTFTLFADIYPAVGSASVCHPVADTSAPDARPGDCSYEVNQNEKVADYTLGNGITISDFCAYRLNAWSCAHTNGGPSSLDIVFSRPNPDPFISIDGAYSASFPATAACFTISSPQGGSRFVSVASSGEVTASAASCP